MPTTSAKVAKILIKVNVARTISDHLLGENHPIKHRMWVGAGVMTLGVLISKILHTNPYVHLIFDGIGYMVHGAGAIPFIDWFGREKEIKDDSEPEKVTSGVKEVTDVVDGK